MTSLLGRKRGRRRSGRGLRERRAEVVRPRSRMIDRPSSSSHQPGRAERPRTRRGGEERLPYGCRMTTSSGGRMGGGSLSIDPRRRQGPALDPDRVGLAYDVEDDRHPYPDEHRVLQRYHHRQNERDRRDDRLCTRPMRTTSIEPPRIDRPDSRPGSAARPARAWRLPDDSPRTKDHQPPSRGGNQQRQPRSGAGGSHERCRGHRAADRHALEDPARDVRGTLADEVAATGRG